MASGTTSVAGQRLRWRPCTSWPIAPRCPPRRRTARRRCRGPCGPRSRTGSQRNRWPAGGGIHQPATTIGGPTRCGGCRRRLFHDRTEKAKNAMNGRPHIVVGKPQRKKPQMARMAATQIGRAHPEFLLALDHQAVVDRPLRNGRSHFRLGLSQLLARLDGLLRLELRTGPHDLQRRPDRDAHRVDVGPRPVTCRTADGPLAGVDLPEVDELSFCEIEQRRGQPVLGNRLGADVLGLDWAESGRRRVLHGKSRRWFDGGSVPEERTERGSDAQAHHPRDTGDRSAEDPIPVVVPRQTRARRGRHVDARPQGDRGPRFELTGGELAPCFRRRSGWCRRAPHRFPPSIGRPLRRQGSVTWTSTRLM